MIFSGCEESVTSNQEINSEELTPDLISNQGPTLDPPAPPAPDVEHSVDTFNPYFSWPKIDNVKEYKFQREECCTTFTDFTVAVEDLDSFIEDGIDKVAYNDDDIIHSHLDDVGSAIPDEWLRYRIKAVFDNDEESLWTDWLYYHLPEENHM